MNRRFLSLSLSATLGLFATALLATNAVAQVADQPDAYQDTVMEEVVVTGSAIERTDLENTLPIQIIDADDISRSGIETTTELIARLPAMQNFIHAGDSVGGGGGGLLTANLRGIGTQYTLVLLNGRRVAPADSGSTIDLASIPLAAIERVEILTDGASALYGADAIAGVVNFILKTSVEGTTLDMRYNTTDAGGGDYWDASVVAGIGDTYADGYSMVFTYSHIDQEQLRSKDRGFAKTGFIFFNHPDYSTPLYFQNSSANSIPGNAFVYTAGFDDFITGFNPFAEANGSCDVDTTPDGRTCRFDYTSTLEILPEQSRDTIYLNGEYMFNNDLKGFGTFLYSKNNLTARIAPYPSGEVSLPFDSALVAQYVLPYLTETELAMAGEVTGTWRARPASNRTMEYESDVYTLMLGLDGDWGEVNYNTSLAFSGGKQDQNYPTGWLIRDEFVDAVGLGAIDIFAPLDQFDEASQAALEPAIYHGNWDTVENDQISLQASANRPMFDLNGGKAMIAAGFEWRDNNYARTVADANLNEELLFLSPDTPYELERDMWGLFVEALFPVTEHFELTGALRYDDYSGVEDKLNGGTIDQGDDGSTYKISAGWSATDWLRFRASYGTGFKPPSMREIGEPLSEFGVTSGTFACPFAEGDPLAQYCLAQEAQYSVYRQGYAGLKFEESDQYTIGFVINPTDNFDLSVDWWTIDMENLVERLTESQIFGDPAAYRDLFTTKTNLATGREELAIIQAAVNVGTKDNEGIDFTAHYLWDADWGQVDFLLQGTHMLESDSSLTGSSLGRFGADDAVVFEDIFNFNVSVLTGAFTNTLNWNYRSSYMDQEQTVEITGTGVPLGQGPTTDIQLTVDAYSLFDYQLRWNGMEDRLALYFGINNLLDEEPPLSLRVSGAGHQVGWDPRYADAYCRTYYVRGSFHF